MQRRFPCRYRVDGSRGPRYFCPPWYSRFHQRRGSLHTWPYRFVQPRSVRESSIRKRPRLPRRQRRRRECFQSVVSQGYSNQAVEEVDLKRSERLLIIERQGAAEDTGIQEQCVASRKCSGVAQGRCDSTKRLPHDVAISKMLLVAIKRRCAQRDRICAAKKRTGRIGRDAKSSVSHADIRLHVQVCVAVAERERETRIPRQSSPETVGPPMLESIDVTDVVTIFVNVDCAVDGRPKPRLIGRVNLIALELPRENLREGPVVVSKLEIGKDFQ